MIDVGRFMWFDDDLVLERVVHKHLPGQHDQSTHTPKAYRGKRVNSERSRELAQQCDTQSKACFKNSIMALPMVGSDAKYVEGYVVDNVIGFPFEHGWIETEDELLDPTLILLDDDLAARYTYFPANEFTWDNVMAKFDEGDLTLPLTRMGNSKQQQAIRAAMAHIEVVSKLKHLPGQHDQGKHRPKKYGAGDVSSLSADELRGRGYIAVFRGTGPKGTQEVRPSEEGVLGPGVYFYDSPIQARSYAERGGGIVTGFVHPDDVSIEDVPGGMFVLPHRIVVLQDPSKFVRRGDIPTEETRTDFNYEPLLERAEQALDEVRLKQLSTQCFVMDMAKWLRLKHLAHRRMSLLLHRPDDYVLKHQPGRHDQELHTPHKYRSFAGMAKYVNAKRERLEASGVKAQLIGSVVGAMRRRYPNDDMESLENSADLLVGAMSMDEKRFDYYADKYGIEGAEGYKERLFGWNSEQKQVERKLAQAAWKYKDQATVKRDDTGKPDYFIGAGDRLEEAAEASLVGNSYSDAADVLFFDYGVQVKLGSPNISEGVAHRDISKLVNLARAEPALATTLRDCKEIKYTEPDELGSARARATGFGISVVAEEGYEGVPSHVWVHELGHKAHSYHAPDDTWLDEFNKGVHVSSYAWETPMEDFAETWVAVLNGGAKYIQQVPDKTAYVQRVVDATREEATQ